MTLRSGVDRWKQVSELLADDISTGALAPGARLPSSRALATRFGVHRHTVLKAISHLQDQGLLRVEQGRGTFVVEHAVQVRLGQQTWFEQNLMDSHFLPTRQVLTVLEMPAPADAAAALAVGPGDPVVRIEHLGEADGIPIYFGRHYFPAARFPRVADDFRGFGTERSTEIVFARILEAHGFGDFRRKAIRIGARLPDAEEARYLQMGRATPLVETRIVFVDRQDRPVMYGFSAYCSDRVELTIDV